MKGDRNKERAPHFFPLFLHSVFHKVKQQQRKVHGMEIELLQSGKGSGRLLLGCTIIGCTSRMSLYQSVLPKGRRNVPQCFSTQCFTPL
ncbi:hypothetical protein K492DRAFT_174638 [Lichtheimia hyalospora FSU 10163]|nr:hypothetical protein K492DRAFT_174638 [Lichtheimia hyalospora FSU 10163]